MLVLEKITLSFGEFSLLKDNIVLIDYNGQEGLNVERGIQMVESINKLTNNRPAAAIHNLGEHYVFSTDNLKFMGSQLSPERHHYVARAIVTTNPAGRIETTNFINLYKPLIPTKLFATVEAAYQWIEEQLALSK